MEDVALLYRKHILFKGDRALRSDISPFAVLLTFFTSLQWFQYFKKKRKKENAQSVCPQSCGCLKDKVQFASTSQWDHFPPPRKHCEVFSWLNIRCLFLMYFLLLLKSISWVFISQKLYPSRTCFEMSSAKRGLRGTAWTPGQGDRMKALCPTLTPNPGSCKQLRKTPLQSQPGCLSQLKIKNTILDSNYKFSTVLYTSGITHP